MSTRTLTGVEDDVVLRTLVGVGLGVTAGRGRFLMDEFEGVCCKAGREGVVRPSERRRSSFSLPIQFIVLVS